jgi:hypothetical protein
MLEPGLVALVAKKADRGVKLETLKDDALATLKDVEKV